MALRSQPALTRRNLGSLPRWVSRPSYDVAQLHPGIVHIGVGCFHRGHQAAYLDALAEVNPSAAWSVTGVGLRSCSMRTELLSQDLLYTAVQRSTSGANARVVGIHRDYHSYRDDRARVLATLRDERTKIVSLTITAPAYRAEAAESSAFSLIAEGLRRRRRLGLDPFTVMSCDNLPGNGDATRRLVLESAEAMEPGLAEWILENVSFPNSMVDRITPPVSETGAVELSRLLKIRDQAPVVTEVASHWAVEDDFPQGRPPLEEVGVQLVTDVRPHVEMKMRMLNAAHVAIGFLGGRLGHLTTDDALNDPALFALVDELTRAEVMPLLDPVPGVYLPAYQREVLERLRNPAMRDPVERLRRRGSVRVQNYVLPSLERAVARRAPHAILTGVVAAWIEEVRRVASYDTSTASAVAALGDELAGPLLAPARMADRDVRPFLAVAPGFQSLRQCPDFVESLQSILTGMSSEGHAAAS
jgi:mannitol 2-dehydrogenase